LKRILFICFLLGWCTLTLCQTGKVTGSVMDAATKTPLELATITVFGVDSSVIAYQLSDRNGIFKMEKLPVRKKLLVSISYAGYISHNESLQLDAGRIDTLSIFLALNNKDTQGVVVTAVLPFRMNGDTLEINPAAFKMKNDAVVEELLNQVSGITIWSDGTITVNGRQVQSLLVDGKPFMGSTDSRIATQNLPKSAIDKIQLYQEYDRSKIGQENLPQDSLLTMNIKLKENSKKGFFGKAGVGYGTMDRFESDLSLQMYNKNSSAGIGGGYNNINKSIGNLQEMFQNNTYRNINPNLYNVGRFGASGINRTHSIGAVLMHSFIESANSRQNNRVTVNYTKSGTNTYLTDLSLQNRTTIDNIQFIRDEGILNSRQDRHDVGVDYTKTNSYNDNLGVNGAVNSSTDRSNSSRISEVRDSISQLQSTNSGTMRQTRKSDGESLNVRFAKSNSEEPSKSFSLQLNARHGNSSSQRDVTSIFQSFTDMSQNTTFNRRYATDNENLAIGGTLDYTGFKRLLLRRYNLFGINLNLTQSFNYSRSSDNTVVGDYDSTGKQYRVNGDLSNNNRREVADYTPSLTMSKSFYNYSEAGYRNLYVQIRLIEEFKTDKNMSSFVKRNLDRSFQFFRYEGSLNYQYQKRQKFRYNLSGFYTRNFEYPGIDQLYTIVDEINAYDIRIGNPLLKNKTNHVVSANASFNTENPNSTYFINGNINGGYTLSLNPVTDSIINDFSGKRTYYYINADKTNSQNLNYNLNISRKLKKNGLQLTYSGNFRNSKLPNFIDGISNVSKTVSLYNQINLQFSSGSVLVVNIQQSMQQYKSLPSAAQLNSFKNNNSTTRLGVVINYPANFTFSSTVDRIRNSNLDKPSILWNTFATYRFMKQQGELKFSAMDLLKQYQNITNSANAYGTSTRITNGLRQYFLLTFSYYPRKFGKTEIKRQGGNQER
jgi:hypothetical protein